MRDAPELPLPRSQIPKGHSPVRRAQLSGASGAEPSQDPRPCCWEAEAVSAHGRTQPGHPRPFLKEVAASAAPRGLGNKTHF